MAETKGAKTANCKGPSYSNGMKLEELSPKSSPKSYSEHPQNYSAFTSWMRGSSKLC